MSESASIAAGGLLAKFLPAGIGAVLIAIVDPPQNKREMFLRVFVAMIFSYAFSRLAFDFLHQISMLSFLDWDRDEHRIPIEGMVGASGWFVLGAAAMALKKFRADPVAAMAEAKKDLA